MPARQGNSEARKCCRKATLVKPSIRISVRCALSEESESNYYRIATMDPVSHVEVVVDPQTYHGRRRARPKVVGYRPG
jgi:hypothetical protein